MNLRKDKKIVNFNNADIITAILAEAKMKVGFEMKKKSELLVLSFIGGVLIMLVSITGCSDVPYTGQIVTVEHVDQYLGTIDQNTVCLQDGFDTVCIKLMLDDVEITETNVDYAPIVHVHPTSLSYIFYYEGKPILSAKKGMDTSELVQELANNGRVQLPADLNNLGNSRAQNNFEGWTIEIYYLDSAPPTNRRLTLGNSGFDIRVVEGARLLSHHRKDLQIRNFARTDEFSSSPGVQFSVETQAQDLTLRVGGLVPGHTAKFYISADGVESDSQTNVLQLQPL